MHHHPPDALHLALYAFLAIGYGVSAAWQNLTYRVSRWNAQAATNAPKRVRWTCAAIGVACLAGLFVVGFSDAHGFAGGIQAALGLSFVLYGVATILQERKLTATAALEAYLGLALIWIGVVTLAMTFGVVDLPLPWQWMVAGGGVLCAWWCIAALKTGAKKQPRGDTAR